MNTFEHEVDVLVIGGGTAGPMAAVKAKQLGPGLRVLQVAWHPDSDAHLAVLTSGGQGQGMDAGVGTSLRCSRAGCTYRVCLDVLVLLGLQ